MSYNIRVVAKSRDSTRAAIERKMTDVSRFFPLCAIAKGAILALFDSQPHYSDDSCLGYIVEAHGGVDSVETLVRITRLREEV